MKEQIRKERGITLIALVITIIVLLILAAISIATLTGENGILTKASDSSFKQDSSAVLEKLKLEILDMNADDKINNSETIKIEKLMEKGLIDSNYVVNVEKLLANNKILTGKGTIETGDIYKLEKDTSNAYDLNYYDKDNNKQQIGDNLFVEEDGSFPAEDYLDITSEGEITLKNPDDFYIYREEYGNGVTLVIPSTIRGITVTSVAEGAFSLSYYIREIILPNTINKIGDYAFYECIRLEKVVLPENLTEIGNEIFVGCNLKEINIPDKVTKIGNYAFSGNDLKTIELPTILTTIGNHAFSGNDFETIELPSGLTTMGEGTFGYCRSLKSIEIPPIITRIPQDCFENCSNLESVKIPKSVTTVEVSNNQYTNTFMNCEKVLVTVEAGSPLKIENFTAAGLKAEQVVFE